MKKLSTIKKKIEAEIVLIKEQGEKYDPKNDKKIIDALKAVTGYVAMDNNEDEAYILKATNEEIWQYYLDTIIPKLEGDIEPARPDTVNKQGKHLFSDIDKRRLSEELAEQCIRVEILDSELKKIKSDYKAKLDGVAAKIKEFSQKIQSGWELRDFECIIEKDLEEKTITYIDVDTDKIIESRKMEPHEYQLAITDKQVKSKKEDGDNKEDAE